MARSKDERPIYLGAAVPDGIRRADIAYAFGLLIRWARAYARFVDMAGDRLVDDHVAAWLDLTGGDGLCDAARLYYHTELTGIGARDRTEVEEERKREEARFGEWVNEAARYFETNHEGSAS